MSQMSRYNIDELDNSLDLFSSSLNDDFGMYLEIFGSDVLRRNGGLDCFTDGCTWLLATS